MQYHVSHFSRKTETKTLNCKTLSSSSFRILKQNHPITLNLQPHSPETCLSVRGNELDSDEIKIQDNLSTTVISPLHYDLLFAVSDFKILSPRKSKSLSLICPLHSRKANWKFRLSFRTNE